MAGEGERNESSSIDNTTSHGKPREYTAVSFSLDQQTGRLSAKLSATDQATEFSLADLQSMVGVPPFNNLYYEADSLSNLLLRIARHERGFFAVAERRDPEVFIDVSPDKMSATLTTTASYGGHVLTATELQAAIETRGIVFDYCDKDSIRIAMETPVKKLKFVEGKEPVDGVDAKFIALVDEVIIHTPKVDDTTGKVDFHNVHEFTIVDKGTPVMRRVPAVAGVNGFDVCGLVLPAAQGDELRFAVNMKGVMVDEKDENLLVAAEMGHPVILSNGVLVDKTLTVENVDIKTGDITMDGSLLVKGDVSSDLKIEVTGSVLVNGIVGAASIRADHDIIVAGGIIGGEDKEGVRQNDKLVTANLIAGGCIKARFVSFAQLDSGRDVEVAEYIGHSKVAAQGRVLLGQAGGKGCLYGGLCHGGKGVVANVVGTKTDVKTSVSAGEGTGLQEQYNNLCAEKSAITIQRNQLMTVLNQYIALHKKNSLSQEKLEKGKVIKSTIDALALRISEIEALVVSVKKVLKNSVAADILVTKAVFPNVQVIINGCELPVRLESKGSRFFQQGNEIKWNSL